MLSAVSRFELRAGAMRLALRPDLGGCIAGLWHRDVPILRSAEPAALSGPRESGCFALLPYSNRLGYRRFRWQGVDHTTQANVEDSPHSLHGVGWLRPWQIASSSAAEVVLRYRHEADADWPFAFEARQYIHLTPQLLRLQLVFDNLAAIAQPVGLGWHCCFPKRTRSRLHLECEGRWDTDAAQLPVRKVAQAGIDADLRHLDYDHGFDGWRGAARIRDETMSLQLSASLDRVVVCTPPQADGFCVDPVSHVSNAIHMADPLAHGLRSVAPGASTEAWMQLDVRVL